jgi:DNA-binding response OmpR family regulator
MLEGTTFDDPRRMIVVRGEGRRLQMRTWEVLAVLRRRPAQVVSRAAIVDAVWGVWNDPPNQKSVDIHVMQIRRALEGSPYAIRCEWGIGWSLVCRSEAEMRRALPPLRLASSSST